MDGVFQYGTSDNDGRYYVLYIIWLEVLPYNAHCYNVRTLHSINTPLVYAKRRVSRVQTTKTFADCKPQMKIYVTKRKLSAMFQKQLLLCFIAKKI